MNCINHENVVAVGNCPGCGAALCKECFTKSNLCDACLEAGVKGVKSMTRADFIRTVVISVIGGAVCGGVFMGIAGEFDFLMFVFLFWIGAGVPWGWSVLTKLTPSIFLVLPLIGWLIYFMVKLSLAMTIGMVAMPIKLGMGIYNIHKANKL